MYLTWQCLAAFLYLHPPRPRSLSLPPGAAYHIRHVRGFQPLQHRHPPLHVARHLMLSPDASVSLW